MVGISVQEFAKAINDVVRVFNSKGRQKYVPEQIVFNGDLTICIFPDGEKILARPCDGDKFYAGVGVSVQSYLT